MSVIIALAALALLMLAAYRGYSVILFAPIAALGAVLLTDPSAVAPAFTGVFMEKMVGFIKLYFPVFLLGAVFGKLIELSGFSRSIVAAAIRLLGTRQAMLVIVLVCALLTYGGVSLFVLNTAAVVVFLVIGRSGSSYQRSRRFWHMWPEHPESMVAVPDLDGAAWGKNTQVLVHQCLLHESCCRQRHVLYHDQVKLFILERPW